MFLHEPSDLFCVHIFSLKLFTHSDIMVFFLIVLLFYSCSAVCTPNILDEIRVTLSSLLSLNEIDERVCYILIVPF